MSQFNLLTLMTLAIIYTVSAQIVNPLGRNCSSSETYSQCGTWCEPSCTNKNPVYNPFCQGYLCIGIFTGGCRCNPNLLRDDLGTNKCIPEANCTKLGVA